MEYKKDYFGYVYLWHDRKRKMYYLGGHVGSIEDNYVCSSSYMLNAYKKRPEDFKMRVITYIKENNKELLREREQYYLDMIDESELSTSKNVMTRTNRYYNMKKNSVGGNGSANKGNSNIGGWNRGLKLGYDQWNKGKIGIQPHSEETRKKMSEARKLYWKNKPRTIKIKFNKECPSCQKAYFSKQPKQIYCSRKCIPHSSHARKISETQKEALSVLAKTRYRIYREDRTWFWGHKEKED